MRSSVIREHFVKSLTILVYYRLLAKACLWRRDRGKRGNCRGFLDDSEGSAAGGAEASLAGKWLANR
jgi:hypothetical protein